MNTALWVLQGLLAAVFISAGAIKTFVPKSKLVAKLTWAEDYSDVQVKLIGLVELLGGIGLVVPWYTGILPILTPIAAAALVPVMVGAAVVHVRRKEPPYPAVVLGLLSLALALGRFGVFGY